MAHFLALAGLKCVGASHLMGAAGIGHMAAGHAAANIASQAAGPSKCCLGHANRFAGQATTGLAGHAAIGHPPGAAGQMVRQTPPGHSIAGHTIGQPQSSGHNMIGQLSGHTSGHNMVRQPPPGHIAITDGSGHAIGQTPGHTCTAGHSAGYGCTGHAQTGGNATRSAHAGPVHSAGSVGSNHDSNIGGGLGGGPHPHGSDIGREITDELIKEVFKELWKKEISRKDKGQKPTGEKLPPRRRRLWQKRDRNGYSYSVSAHFDHESLHQYSERQFRAVVHRVCASTQPT